MTRYRKRPVEVEAQQLTAANAAELVLWCDGTVIYNTYAEVAAVIIRTLEGAMRAEVGDWIVCGTEGEFYPCKPGAFAKTYEEVT